MPPTPANFRTAPIAALLATLALATGAQAIAPAGAAAVISSTLPGQCLPVAGTLATWQTRDGRQCIALDSGEVIPVEAILVKDPTQSQGCIGWCLPDRRGTSGRPLHGNDGDKRGGREIGRGGRPQLTKKKKGARHEGAAETLLDCRILLFNISIGDQVEVREEELADQRQQLTELRARLESRKHKTNDLSANYLRKSIQAKQGYVDALQGSIDDYNKDKREFDDKKCLSVLSEALLEK
jgi:hypothetical protein